ncbi:LGFP repeat-containing protein [Microbispora sp. NPDC049125]|uniref:LGFP repeat-containing protein n=1 Tax=Microbispora sp. NPDC049125 TaxID=3154929 RepID=UPI003465F115
MNRRFSLSVSATLALSTAVLVGLPVYAGSATAATTTSACNPAFAPYGLIGDKWRASGGESSIFGCPTRAEYGFTANHARRQDFRNGQIGWSPALGPKMLIRTYASGGKAVFQWGPTGRDWDYFEVRYSFNNEEVKTYKVKRRDPWNGGFSRPIHGPGPEELGSTGELHYFSVRGCDNSGVFQLGSECSGWSLPGRL